MYINPFTAGVIVGAVGCFVAMIVLAVICANLTRKK